MRSLNELDNLFDRVYRVNGWLSYLQEAQAISPREEAYLVWRSENEDALQDKLQQWMKEIESYGGLAMECAETPAERLLAVVDRIAGIDRRVMMWPLEFAETYREMTRYRHLMLLRAELRLQLDPPDRLPDWKIERARAYRLDDLLKSQLKRKFMVCPIHKEKHGSFFVTSFGYCFGCMRSWDSISWLMEFEQLTFPQAVERLSSL